jgi:cytochrome P450
LWQTVQGLAVANNAKSDTLLREYVLEAQRLTSSQRNLRIATTSTSIDGQNINRGDAVLCLLGEAGRDAQAVQDPFHFKPGRGQDSITFFSMGVHECVGREIAIEFITGLVKLTASLKNLRPAPGNMGLIKAIQVGTEKCYLSDNWSHLTFDPTSMPHALFPL